MKDKPKTGYNFQMGWYTIGFGKPWDVFGTYGLIPFELLPPVDTTKFKGEFQWLPETYKTKWDAYSMVAHSGENLSKIFNAAHDLGIELPYDFIEFMRSFGDQNNMISVTDCYFDLSDKIVKTPGENSEYFIRFMEDGQSVMHWYLYIDQVGNSWVATTNRILDSNYPKDVSLEKKLENVVICAPTIEEFLYRFWIEVRIWLANSDNFGLTSEEEEYMNTAIGNITNIRKNITSFSSCKKLIERFGYLIDPDCKNYFENKLKRLEKVNNIYDLNAGNKIIEDLNQSLFRLSYQKRDELTIHSNFGVVLFTLRKLSETRWKNNPDYKNKLKRFRVILRELPGETDWNIIKMSGIYAEMYDSGAFVKGSIQCPKCGTFNTPSDIFCFNEKCRASWIESIDFNLIDNET